MPKEFNKCSGYFVVYTNTIDMYKKINPIGFGKCHWKYSNGSYGNKKALDYYHIKL